jgi:uncharacterized protein (TIGR03437 family)
VTATLSITNAASALALSPGAVTITCLKNGTSYTPGSAQTVNVTSPANSGTPFTVDNVTNALPSWLSVTPLTGGLASATPVALGVVAATGCGGLNVGSTSFSVHLLNAPAPDKLLLVTIQVGGASPLSASVSPVPLSYTTGTSTFTAVTSAITASPAAFFTVNPASLPIWLNVTPTNGTTPTTLSFAPTAAAKTLPPGDYTASVHLVVSGDLDLVIPVSLEVQNPTATLTIAEGTTRTINWVVGTALPSLVVTPVSTSSPIPFTVTTTAGSLSPQVSTTNGLAYSFGSPITVTFLQSTFAAAAPGAVLTGDVIVTPSGGSAIQVAITVNVESGSAVITSLTPSSLPTAPSGTFTVAVSGSGFVVSGNSLIATSAGIVTAGFIVPDPNVVASIVNSTTIVLTITVPSTTDPYLPFSGAGGSVIVGVCNPQGATCITPTSTGTLTIGVNPNIQAVTSSASYFQATPPALTPVAPYDVLAVFGTNFCVSGGTGCTGSNAILYGTLDPVTLRYLSALSPDAAGPTQRSVSATFQTHGRTPTAIANAPLLFVTNGQINLVVPDGVSAYIGKTVDIVVNFGYGTGATILSSAPYSVTITSTDPGLYSVTGNGIGDAAALSASYALIGSTNPAAARNPASDSDTVQLYLSGLGKPDSTNSGTGYSATCMPAAGYFAAVNSATSISPALTTDDGLVLQSSLFPSGELPPCILATGADVPTVTIGGVPGTVAYAGWVAGTIAGLYQINVTLPSAAATFTDASGNTGPVTSTALHLPVVVTANGMSSQPTGLNLWVVQKLLVTPAGPTTGTHSAAWAGITVTATDGVGPYTYAVTTGTLPTGVTLTTAGVMAASGGTLGSGTAGTYPLVITATDTSGNNLTGTVALTLTIN